MLMKKYNIAFRLLIVFGFTLIIKPYSANAQKDFPHDTSYYETYPNKITGRLFLSQKYVHLNFPASGNVDDLEYKANAKLNMGIGVTLHSFSVNVFYGFSFLNKKDEAKGKTKGLNVQMHLYPRKWAIDLLAVFPKGFYLDPKGFAAANANSYYYRPDIKLTLMGLSAYRVPNKQKFSYRAAIIQSEWQKKSAGSVLFGGQAYYGTIKGDTAALVPKKVQSNFPQAGINKINFFSFGPGIGYAYTLVIAKHLFITGSVIGNLDLNFTNEEGISKNNKVGLSPAEVFKAAVGYNSSNWNVSVNWTGNGLWFKGASSSENYFWPTGNYKFVIAKKFTIKKHHGG
jgi:Domain of unknown function (DUF4421)